MTDPGETESIVSLKLFSSLFSRNFVKIERLLTPCKGMSILESKETAINYLFCSPYMIRKFYVKGFMCAVTTDALG